jgi:hypothetical protein
MKELTSERMNKQMKERKKENTDFKTAWFSN